MARMVTSVQLDVDYYNRLANARATASSEIRFNDRSLGLGPMLGLLLDHWEQHPPTPEWLRERAQVYPKRGRPPKQVKGTPVSDPNEKRRLGYHEILTRRREEKAPHKINFCKNCTMEWATWDTPRPPAQCPAKTGFSTIYNQKKWTKSELLAAGFEPDEVEWCDEP